MQIFVGKLKCIVITGVHLSCIGCVVLSSFISGFYSSMGLSQIWLLISGDIVVVG